MPELHQILYCSVLAPDHTPSVVGRIVGAARQRNASEGITGLLVFDGLRFCQHLEGPPGPVQRLMQRLHSDPRHTHMQVLFEGGMAQRRYHRFELGLAEVEEREELADLHLLPGEEALQRFLTLRSSFDISG